ncbi:hypothetical protein SOHN41_00559 [Shewanella sp. HN-41]|nr:hypothetical protein SOHN41_00559 [Shewanella sp. HN-41]
MGDLKIILLNINVLKTNIFYGWQCYKHLFLDISKQFTECKMSFMALMAHDIS